MPLASSEALGPRNATRPRQTLPIKPPEHESQAEMELVALGLISFTNSCIQAGPCLLSFTCMATLMVYEVLSSSMYSATCRSGCTHDCFNYYHKQFITVAAHLLGPPDNLTMVGNVTSSGLYRYTSDIMELEATASRDGPCNFRPATPLRLQAWQEALAGTHTSNLSNTC